MRRITQTEGIYLQSAFAVSLIFEKQNGEKNELNVLVFLIITFLHLTKKEKILNTHKHTPNKNEVEKNKRIVIFF